MPVLLEAGCDFKIIADPYLLQDLNAGFHGGPAVGKAVTIYPSEDVALELAQRLADKLRGFEAPRVNSDRRLRPDAPVYYRFGPISPRLRVSDAGSIDVAIRAPDGRVTSGLASEIYSSPDWASDPLSGSRICGARLPRIDGALVIGEYYRITSAITSTFRGATYRAVDLRTGLRVVIKEARAFVNETSDGDVRAYLRNERRVLTALEGISGLPEIIDHFAYGDDEFLVTSDLGNSNLRRDVFEHGIFAWESNSPRNALDLGRAILRILDDIHQRGVIYRDLAPKNVVPLVNGGWGLVDFELSCFEGVQRYGWTAAYSQERQRRNEPGAIEDDYFSLGATMFYAVTGLDPIIIDQSPQTDVARTVRCLSAICGEEPPIVGLIRDLLASDVTVQSNAAQQLRTATIPRRALRTPSAPVGPPVELVFRHTLDATLGHASAILARDVRKHSLPPPPTAFGGTAGIAMELIQHADGLTAAMELAKTTALVAKTVDIPPGLLFGRMGICLALRATADATLDTDLHRSAETLMPGEDEVAKEHRVDVAHGLAGLGIGYLALAATSSNPTPYQMLADQCVVRLLGEEETIHEQLVALPVGNPAHGISLADGFAHGRAGIAYCLLAHASASGHSESRRRARRLINELADLTAHLAVRAQSRLARPMSASWCQGLAGIGTTLVRGAQFFGDERFLRAARTAAVGCMGIAPRVPLVTQCCGLAGIGEFLLDLAAVSGDIYYRQSALDIFRLMLIRSGGSRTALRSPDNSIATGNPSWATGAAGVLSFLRRLVDPSGPRLWMLRIGIAKSENSA